MNLVVDEAVEVGQVTKTNEKETRRPLGMDVMPICGLTILTIFAGRILLKGDNVSLIQNLSG